MPTTTEPANETSAARNSREWRATRQIADLPADRTFGIELEINPTLSRQEIADSIRAAFRTAGISREVVVEGYGHAGRGNRKWIVKTDASCGRRQGEGGYEIVSPVLKGWNGIEEVRAVMETVDGLADSRGVRLINPRCGMHVHVGADGLGVNGLKNLVAGVKRFEPMFLAISPASRFNSRWAKPVEVRMDRIKNARTTEDIRAEWESYPNAASSDARYHGLNLSPYWDRGSVEFRYFAGTMNFEKAAFAIVTCVCTVETAKRAGTIRCPKAIAEKTFDEIWADARLEGFDKFLTRFFRDFVQVKSSANSVFRTLKSFAKKRARKFYGADFRPVRAAA